MLSVFQRFAPGSANFQSIALVAGHYRIPLGSSIISIILLHTLLPNGLGKGWTDLWPTCRHIESLKKEAFPQKGLFFTSRILTLVGHKAPVDQFCFVI